MATKSSAKPTLKKRKTRQPKNKPPVKKPTRQNVNVKQRHASANNMKHVVTQLTLRNGAKGLLIHIPDASVMSFEFNFRAGDYLVEEKKWETPHLMEHMLLGANERYPKSRLFQAEIEKNGA